MSAIVTSRTGLFWGLLNTLAQSKAKLSCGSCGNSGAWKKISRPSPAACKTNNNGLLRTISSKVAPRSDVRSAEIAVEDISSECEESTNRINAKRPHKNITSIDELLKSDPSLRSPDYFQVHNIFTVRDLYDARVHLGHKGGSLNPRMNDFIFGSRFDSVIFDLDKTAFHLRQALNFTAHVAYRGGIIMFVTRSPQTMHLVEQNAIECGEYAHCREWHTHIMTNSEDKFGGITRLPDLMILLNTLDTVMSPHRAVYDANKMLIPTVGIVDSNCDPNLITYPVPGNDDSLSAVQFYCKVFKEAILRAKQKKKVLDKQKEQLEKEGTIE